jgi:cell division protein FtsB
VPAREEIAALYARIAQLEQAVEQQRAEMEKLKKDVYYFEMMLLEEYHMLLRLLGAERQKVRLHSL